jgi:uncharacterized protein (DUF736 family)
MTFEIKEGNGALFKNDRKEKDSQPDFKGDAKINGEMYWVSAWIRTSKGGMRFMSLAIEKKTPRDEFLEEAVKEAKESKESHAKKPETVMTPETSGSMVGGKFLEDDIPF